MSWLEAFRGYAGASIVKGAKSGMVYANVLPEALRELGEIRRWVSWEQRLRDGKSGDLVKVPINPRTGGNAMPNESSTWSDFDLAYEMFRKLKIKNADSKSGVGFFLGGGYAGIDIDDCIDESGKISDMAGRIIESMNTYTEISPRGHGVHMLFRVSEGFTLDGKQGARNDELGLEIYCGARYLTVTGNVYGAEKPIEFRENEVLENYREYFVNPRKNDTKKQRVNVSQRGNVARITGNESDNELWERMFNSQNGAKIRALYNGDISGHDNDNSRADLALCTYLAYWTGNDAVRMDSMFRQSGLMRGKWDEKHGAQTYGAMTIAKAISTTPIYSPPVNMSRTANNPAKDSGHDEKAVQEVKRDIPQGNSVQSEKDTHTVLMYLEKSLYGDLERVKVYRTRKTGYSNIDRYNSLFPGLYVIGSVTGNGKTTFCGQMADNLARAGELVLYFTLEQTELELVTKGLARLTAQEWLDKYGADALTKYTHTDAMSAIDIRAGRITGSVKRAIEQYKTFAERLRIIECGFGTDINAICETVKNFMATHGGVKPVVFVDYLQLVRNPNPRLSTKEAVDDNVRAFKKLSAENELAVIVISSLNRQNYLSVIDFEAFKESGGIEYTADVIWGLQLLVMNAGVFNTDKDLQTKRKFVHEAKNATPRKIELCGLKNRYGRSNTRYFFDYYAEYDLFIPYECEASEIDAEMAESYQAFKARSERDSTSTGKAKRV